jgi:hypothetical protein
MPDRSAQTSRAAIPLEAVSYTTRALDASTWDAFAELVERNNGIYGGAGASRITWSTSVASVIPGR